MAILYSREADIKPTLVLRDAASTYITTYSLVISTEEGVGKNHSNYLISLKRFGISKLTMIIMMEKSKSTR